jgi:hypothetical protein
MGHAPEPMADIHQLHEDDQIQPPPEGVPPVLAQRHALKQEFEPPVLDDIAVEDEPEGLVEALAPEPEPESEPESEAESEVVADTVAIDTVVADTFEPRPVSVAAASRIARATLHKHKAAFTLRLDEERHLRLRLASAVSGRSAQQIVTGALDAFLESLPEVDELARQLPTRVKG